VISGPGGAGKGTIVARLRRLEPDIWVSRSWSTRARRPGEPADAYHFVTEDEFQALIEKGGFLEWVQFLEYRQGTPMPDPPPGADVLFEIDVNGARAVKEHYPDALLLFIDAPSREEQERRLRSRGADDDQKVRMRLAKAEGERLIADEIGMVRLVNDDLDRIIAEIRGLIAEARAKEAG
jgi:guanylate kinase